MEPEVIDWDNIDSVFIEDDTYENLNAPKWVDLSASPEQPVDDDAWFCKPGCKHPKTVEDYLRSKRGSKVKFLKSATISEMLPFRERNRRRKGSIESDNRILLRIEGPAKKKTIKRSTKKVSSGVLSEMAREKERMPLLALKERQAV
ncbi:hypothetical protein DKX38_023805 [Salix brachista]|uniref:Uncharacterized protein n=1 Tax=Salix brachista TaxID=2182728 RepID=A0A5N5JLQ4_9ROSI|nr:hypothetical protein DKX38_023805 [Salix brachista]